MHAGEAESLERGEDERLSVRKRLQALLVAVVGWLSVWTLGTTARFQVEGWETIERLKASGEPAILSFWHNQILLATYFWRFRDIVVITSRHFDGEYIARIIGWFGYRAARGSRTRGALRALLELKGHLQKGRDVAFTIDGPRGPVYRVKPGPLFLSSKTGFPVVCFHVEPRSYWVLNSWDRFRIPRPFTRVLVKIGQPLRVSTAVEPGRELAAYQAEMERIKDPLWTESLASLRKYGTTDLVAIINEIGRLPTKNHWTGFYDDADDIGPEIIAEKYRIAQEACHGCAIGCKYIIRVNSGKYSTGPIGGPEYETIMAFGSNCLNNDIESVFHLGKRCDLLGLDTISTGKTIGFAMDLYEQGIISAKDADGLDLNWGNDEAQVELVEKIAKREGFGDTLANGVRKAAEMIGGEAWRYAVHVKGLEASGQDPRAHQSIGLTYATNVRGADHLRSISCVEELGYPEIAAARFGEEKAEIVLDIMSPVHKGQVVWDMEDLYAIVDSAVICKYGTMWPPVYYFDTFVNIIPHLTGMTEWGDPKFVRKAAERISHLRRAYNHRLGVTRKEETLPPRLLTEPMPTGPSKGGLPDLDHMLDDYYEFRGCDRETGYPKESKLKELDLDFVVDDLKPRGMTR